MTTQGFVATHAKDARFERGLRAFFEYRDLGIKAATKGRFAAHVIRACTGSEFSSQPHLHRTEFQLVYHGPLALTCTGTTRALRRTRRARTSARSKAIKGAQP
jgi:hypothetical protein